jgi:hypothetical protein
MVRFIDQHRDTLGVEPICGLLPIAPVMCPPSTEFVLERPERHESHMPSFASSRLRVFA